MATTKKSTAKPKAPEVKKAPEATKEKAATEVKKPVEVKTKIGAVNPTPKTVEVQGEQVLVFKASRVLTPGEFRTLSGMLKHEQVMTGLKIILLPFSAEQA
jgi:methionyl-tRNA formyltransferase